MKALCLQDFHIADSIKKSILTKPWLQQQAMGNSCVKMKGDIVLVCNILFDDQQDSVFIAVKKFNCVDDFYAYPCASSCLYFEVISSSGNDKMSYDMHNNLLSHTDFK